MNRFKMSFDNSGFLSSKVYNNLGANISRTPNSIHKPVPKSVSLNTPMIERIYKAKSGCSACGKKVA
jgi:hypothetical protein